MKIKFGKISFCLFLLAAHASSFAFTEDCTASASNLNVLVEMDEKLREKLSEFEKIVNPTNSQKKNFEKYYFAESNQNIIALKKIVLSCGWPTEKKASHSAWLLSQHADTDLAFQHQVLLMLEKSVHLGISAPRDLAYLADRIAANEHRPQEYGTQFSQPDRCHLILDPIDNIELVNRRRAAIGLDSLEAYEAEGRKRFIPDDCEK